MDGEAGSAKGDAVADGVVGDSQSVELDLELGAEDGGFGDYEAVEGPGGLLTRKALSVAPDAPATPSGVSCAPAVRPLRVPAVGRFGWRR